MRYHFALTAIVLSLFIGRLSAALPAEEPVGGPQTRVPASVVQYAKGMHDTLVNMVTSDPGMMHDIGMSKAQLSQTSLNEQSAFPLYRVDATRVESAKDVAQAVVPTGIYYIPMCNGGSCPVVAAFAVDPQTGQPAFVSVGQPKFTQNYQQTSAKLNADPDIAGERQVVQFSEAHADFTMVTRTDTGEQVLVPHSQQEAQALLQMVKNPQELQNSRTRVGGLYTFRADNLGEIATYVHDHMPPEFEGQTPTSGGIGAFNKPVNHGPDGKAIVHAAGKHGAVLSFEAPTPMLRKLAPEPFFANNEKAQSRPAPQQELASSSKLPGYAALTVIALSVFFGLLAYLFRKVKSAV